MVRAAAALLRLVRATSLLRWVRVRAAAALLRSVRAVASLLLRLVRAAASLLWLVRAAPCRGGSRSTATALLRPVSTPTPASGAEAALPLPTARPALASPMPTLRRRRRRLRSLPATLPEEPRLELTKLLLRIEGLRRRG